MPTPLLLIPVAIALLFPLGGLWLGYITPGAVETVNADRRSRVLLGITWVVWLVAALNAAAVAIFASMFVPS
ncbi:MAG: hypothetical protein PHU75_05925 [Candidatus Nanopelagicales bacterium]|nr:hypothetical protein [Candidatus Nanopelagicales bacterium]